MFSASKKQINMFPRLLAY